MNNFYKEILKEEFIQRFDEEKLEEECIKGNYSKELKEIEDDIEFTFLGCQDKDFEHFLKTPGIYSKLERFRYLLRKYRSLRSYYCRIHPETNGTNLRTFLWRMPDSEDFGEFDSISSPWVIDNGEVICECPGKEINPYEFCEYIKDYIKACYRLKGSIRSEKIDDTFEFIDKRTGIVRYRLKNLKMDEEDYSLLDEHNKELENPETLILKLY